MKEREREHLWASIPWISWCAWPSVFALRMNGNKSWLLKEPAQMWTRVNDSSVFHTHSPMNSHWPLWWRNYVTWNNKKVEGCRHFLSPYLVRLFLFLPFFFSGGWDVPWAPKKKAPKNISWERQEKKTPWFVKSRFLSTVDYFAIISWYSHYAMLADYAMLHLDCKEHKKIKDLSLYAQVVVKNTNVIISSCCSTKDSTDFS